MKPYLVGAASLIGCCVVSMVALASPAPDLVTNVADPEPLLAMGLLLVGAASVMRGH